MYIWILEAWKSGARLSSMVLEDNEPNRKGIEKEILSLGDEMGVEGSIEAGRMAAPMAYSRRYGYFHVSAIKVKLYYNIYTAPEALFPSSLLD